MFLGGNHTLYPQLRGEKGQEKAAVAERAEDVTVTGNWMEKLRRSQS